MSHPTITVRRDLFEAMCAAVDAQRHMHRTDLIVGETLNGRPHPRDCPMCRCEAIAREIMDSRRDIAKALRKRQL